jgi:hypothetical protein
MILGMSVSTFTPLHVVISLIGIFAGLIVLFGMFKAKRLNNWTALFLVTTVLTSVTGFFFHSTSFGPLHALGILLLVVLAVAIPTLYVYQLAGGWRWIYVAGAVASLYFNVFVGVVQAFQELSFLQPLAPMQSEPPFLIAQAVVLVTCVVFGTVAVRSFRPETRTPMFS